MSSDTPDNHEPTDNIETKKPRRTPARTPRKKKAAVTDELTQEALPQAEPAAPHSAEPAPTEAKPTRPRAARRPTKAKTSQEPPPVSSQETPTPLPEPAAPQAEAAAPEEASQQMAAEPPSTEPPSAEEKPEGKRRRRSSSRRSRSKKAVAANGESLPPEPAAEAATLEEAPSPVAIEMPPALPSEAEGNQTSAEPVKKPGRKRKRGPRKKSTAALAPSAPSAGEPQPETTETEEETPEPEVNETPSKVSIKLLINADEPEECRVALLENGKLESFHVETVGREQHKGNIYKGRIVSLETNLQAAFVELGTGKNGFLPFNEIHPEYYNREVPADSHWKGHKMKEVLSEGQEVLVEVVKDVTGNKGASLTTYISLPGRYVVLMPGSDSHGISKKIDKEEERQKLREMLDACNIPEGVGYIIRTASEGITKAALTNDVRFQIKLWQEIKEKAQAGPAPALLYKEQSIIDRFLRDHFSSDIEEILVDSQEAFDQVNNFLSLLPATQSKKTRARLHKGPRPLLNSYNIEEQIDQIFRPAVKLPSGGSIVINPTEALVSIDVNSGSTGRDKNFEDTIFLANMEAAEELARQLRLRDLGGLIVVDFIDMRPMSHIKEVEKKVKASMKRDKAKVDFTRISKFGLMEISRQRMGAPIQTGNYQTCEYCEGHGLVRSVETQALAFLRQIQTGITRKNISTVHCHLPMEVGQYLLNKKRADLAEMERAYRATIIIETDANLKPAQAKIEFIKER